MECYGQKLGVFDEGLMVRWRETLSCGQAYRFETAKALTMAKVFYETKHECSQLLPLHEARLSRSEM
jgi:hypothetical protein